MPVGWFLDQWREQRHAPLSRPAIIGDGIELDYGALLAAIDEQRRRLREADPTRGRVVAFSSDDSPAACALLLALALEGHVAVPCSERMLADSDELFAIAEVQLLVRLAGSERWSIEPRAAVVSNPLTRALIDGGRPGLVCFSSGSTGESKAVLHDFARLLERYRRPRQPRRVLTFLRLDHFGGINTLLQILASGGTAVTLADRSPDAVCRAIERHRIELLPTTPTFLNMMLMADAHRRYDLSSLTLITYGTEVMPEPTLARVCAALPNVRLQQTYGLTELGVMQSKSESSGSPRVKLGGDGFETRIVDGRLWLRSRFAMLGYLNAPSPFDAAGWFDTGDRVEVDGEYLRILGRDSELINVGGEKVHPTEVEAVLLEIPNVREATAYAHKSPVTGQVVAARLVLHEPEDLSALRRRVREFCEPRLARFKIPMKLELADQPSVGERYKKLRPLP